MENLSGVVQQLRQERARVAGELERLNSAISTLGGQNTGSGRAGRGKMSAAGRARIAAAQRARWAKVKAGKSQLSKVVSTPKRKMSAAARKRIVTAQTKRWAKFRAERKG